MRQRLSDAGTDMEVRMSLGTGICWQRTAWNTRAAETAGFLHTLAETMAEAIGRPGAGLPETAADSGIP